MNLAEIRKKAGEAKKVAEENGPVPASDNQTEKNDKEVWLAGLPEVKSDFAEIHNVLAEGDVADLPLLEDDGNCPDPVETEDEAAKFQEQELSAFFEHDAGAVVDKQIPATLPEVESGEEVYDPLAMLLAGRKSGTYGEEVSATDSQPHFSSDIEEYLCFRVADEKYALSIMSIKEIIKPRDVTEVPRMPEFITGVISLRGVIIPVMDMRLRLSLTVGERTGRERVIVLRTHAGFCGVLVDEVIQVVRIQRSAIEEPPAVLDGIDREFVMGLGRVDNWMLILLNLESILDLGIH